MSKCAVCGQPRVPVNPEDKGSLVRCENKECGLCNVAMLQTYEKPPPVEKAPVIEKPAPVTHKTHKER